MPSESHYGLSEETVNANRLKYGSNAIVLEKSNELLKTLKEIVLQPMFILLTCAALVYFVMGELQEAMIMIIAIGFVTGISIYQENKSRSAINALKKLSSPLAKVIRSGHTIQIPSDDIVMD